MNVVIRDVASSNAVCKHLFDEIVEPGVQQLQQLIQVALFSNLSEHCIEFRCIWLHWPLTLSINEHFVVTV